MPILRNTAICFFVLLFFSCIKLSNSLNRTLEELTIVQLAPAHRIVIGGNAGTILSSLDGLTWKTSSIGDTAFNVSAVTFTGRNFVAVGMTSAFVCKIFYSTDAATWTKATGTFGCVSTNDGIFAVAANGGNVVAVGAENGATAALVRYSTDHGVTWTTGACSGCNPPIGKIVYDGTLFLATADGGSGYHTTFTSTNGVSFTGLGISGAPLGVGSSKGNSVTALLSIAGIGVLAGGTDPIFSPTVHSSYSANHGNSWTLDSGAIIFQNNTTPEVPRGLAYSGTRLVAVGDNCRIAFTNSPASLSWTNPPTITGCTAGTVWRGLIYDGSKFVATGTNAGGQGQIAVSPTGSGTDWTITTPGTGPLTGIALSP